MLHGTPENRREAIKNGIPQSHGCVRFLNEDMTDLKDRMKIGDPIIIYDGYETPYEMLLKYFDKL